MGNIKVIVISHRGNIGGPNHSLENNPEQIKKAFSAGYNVEVDVWLIKDRIYLGHDKPEYEVDLKFLKNEKLWCHAKNISALQYLILHNVHCFWHQTDDVVLTSKGFMWTYPGKELTYNSICVMPEISSYTDIEFKRASGVCTDYPERYKQ